MLNLSEGPNKVLNLGVSEYINRGHIITCLIVVLRIKKELLVSEYIDKGYVVTYL